MEILNRIQNKFRRGSGTSLFGTIVILLLLYMLSGYVSLFLLNLNSTDMQISADAIADGVAVSVVEDRDISGAEAKAEELKNLINTYTTSEISDVMIDKDALTDNIVTVSAKTSLEYDNNSIGIARKASTYFEYTDTSWLGPDDGLIPQDGMPIPLYLQGSPTWENIPYGEETIAAAGCGPTSIAMVVSYLNNTVITPADVVTTWADAFYVSGRGSSWEIFSYAANYYDLRCIRLGINKERVIAELLDGNPVICRMGNGHFTSSGHFIVLRGITDDGYVLVNDPASMQNFTLKFTQDLIFSEATQFWAYEK